MSYSTDLCIKIMKRPIPPTVEVLANDLYINANLDKDISISILKDGWALVDNGILLVNECVFQNKNRPQSFKECADQCNVIIRLLRETEKYGKRTVDIFALAKHFSNYVASIYIMVKQYKLEMSTNINDEKYKEMIRNVTSAGERLVFRLNVAAGAALNVESTSTGISNYVGKAGPTLNTIAPSDTSVSQHVGHESRPAVSVAMKAVKLQLSGFKKPVASIPTSEFTGISSPGSVKSIASTTPSKGIKLNLSKSPRSTIGTSQQSMEPATVSETSTLSPEEEKKPTTPSLGARFRNMQITQESKKLDNSGNKGKRKEASESPDHSLTKEYRNQLSAVEAVVLGAKPDVLDNEDYAEILENIKSFDLANYAFQDDGQSAT